MASKWFDYNNYMASKLAQVQKADPAANWTMTTFVKAFTDAGFAGADGAEKHFMEYGQYEELAPNAFFNATEYYRAKAADFYGYTDPKKVTDLDVANVKLALANAKMSAWEHYKMYGNAEGVNPSNGFDTDAYMQAKVDALNSIKDGKTYTVTELKAEFQKMGLSALEHFMLYGGTGAGEVAQEYKGTIPAEFAVPEGNKVNPDSGNVGVTFSLTSGADVINGTTNTTGKPEGVFAGAGDDVFIANDTLSIGDNLNGMGGTNTLKIYGTTTDSFKGVTLNNIQKVYNYSGIDKLDLSAQTGVNEYWVAGGASGSTVSSTVSVATAVGIEGEVGAQTFVFKDATGSADSVKLLLNGAEVGGSVPADVTIASVENIAVVAIGENTFDELKADKLQNLVVTGTGSITGAVNIGAGTLQSIDASANAGGVDLSLTSTDLASKFAFTGGNGNDTITTNAILTKDQYANFKGGNGHDTIGVGPAVSTFDKAAATAINAATGFEALEIDYTSVSGTASLVASEFTVSEFVFVGEITGAAGSSAGASASVKHGKNAVSVTGVENADIFTFTADLAGGDGAAGAASTDFGANAGHAVSFEAKSGIGVTVDTLNFVLDGGVTLEGGAGASGTASGTSIADGGHAVNAEGFSTINLSSLGDANALTGGAAAGTASVAGYAKAGAAMAVDAGATVNIVGDAALTLSSGVFVNGDAASTGKVTINAKDFTGDLNVTTGAGDDSITGGHGDDTITAGKGVDTLTGGEGKDTFVFNNGDSGMGTKIDTITDFAKGTGGDVLKLDDATGVLADAKDVNVSAAIGTGDLKATVKDGVITLSGKDVGAVDTIAEIAGILTAIEGTATKQDQMVAVLEIGGHTYVIGDLVSGSNAATDVIMLQGVTGVTSVTYGAVNSNEFHLA